MMSWQVHDRGRKLSMDQIQAFRPAKSQASNILRVSYSLTIFCGQAGFKIARKAHAFKILRDSSIEKNESSSSRKEPATPSASRFYAQIT